MTAREGLAIPLRLAGVTKSYKTHFWQRPAVSLAGLDLDLRAGEILGLLGPNGAGKTTTIKLSLGLIFPDAGTIELMGGAPWRRESRQRVGYLPENAHFPDDLTGRELVEFAGEIHGLDRPTRRRRAAELLERLGIAHAADRTLRRYSKGMAQRAGMARALVARPELVILDEPMSGLDPIGRREFRDLILELKRDGTTVLFASHVLSDAEMLCDRVAILDRGRLAAVEDLGALARDRRVLWWELETEGEGSLADGAELVARRGALSLWRLPASAEFTAIVRAAEAAGLRPLRLEPRRETLEDLFLRTLGRAGENGR
ncbi:MAG: hypothetical protein Kow0062_09850 [Acidobacteriota bacterium]